MIAVFRVIWNSFAYRLRMREANNLAVSLSMMVAFALPPGDLIYRTLFALVLNIYAYLINDTCDIEVDVASASKKLRQAEYLAAHRSAALAALLGLAALLLGAALWHSWLLLLAFVSNTVIIGAYSLWLKRVPFADLLLMALAGGSMTLVGITTDPQSWRLIGLLCLFSASYETIQVIRDEPEDRAQGVRTTAVLLGATRAAWIFRLIMVCAAIYGVLLLKSWIPAGLVLTLALPLSPERAARSWDLVRLVGGVVWLGLLVQTYLTR